MVLLNLCGFSCLTGTRRCASESSWVSSEASSPRLSSPVPARGTGRGFALSQVRRPGPGSPGGAERPGRRGRVLMCQCVGHNKGFQFPFETQRESPEESAEPVPKRPYICNPLRAASRPVPSAPLPAFSAHSSSLPPPTALPPSFSRSLLSEDPETHCCEAGAGWKGHARTPAAAGPPAGSRCSGAGHHFSSHGKQIKQWVWYFRTQLWVHRAHECVLLLMGIERGTHRDVTIKTQCYRHSRALSQIRGLHTLLCFI